MAAIGLNDAAQRQFTKWLSQHFDVELFKRWQTAPRNSPPEMAFRLVAQSPDVLSQVGAMEAKRLSDQALSVATRMRGRYPDPAAQPSGAAALMVRVSVETFKTYGWCMGHAKPNRLSLLAAPAVERKVVAAPPRYPQYSRADARSCLISAAKMGGPGLAQLKDPMDRITALGALRYAAWFIRGVEGALDTDAATVGAAFMAVQGWSGRTGKDPFDTGYDGNKGPAWRQALALAEDCRTCADAALPHADAAAWRVAEARHAYAAVALNPAMLRNLAWDQANGLMTAAVRHATAAADAPELVRPPRFPAGAEVVGHSAILGLARSLGISAVRA